MTRSVIMNNDFSLLAMFLFVCRKCLFHPTVSDHTFDDGKGNVKLSIYLTKHHDMKTYGEWRYNYMNS